MDDLNSQAFWNEFMRRPDAKAAYQAEKRLEEKKRLWLHEKQAVEERGERRKTIADALEKAPVDIQKLIAPIFHIRVVEEFLWMIYAECEKKGASFVEQLRDDRAQAHLRKMRENFQDGGEARMEELENQWHSLCNGIAVEEEKKKAQTPLNIDIHTLKSVLEFGQECKREGNAKFRDGLYEEALHIYTQGDEVMKKWKVEKHLKNEQEWLRGYHLACLKNKAQAALKLELFQTALDAADAALLMAGDDHKAWYRKVQAQKGLGKFQEADDSLSRLEEVAQLLPDRRQILRDCEAERKRLQVAREKHKRGTKEMLGKAFASGVFSVDRDRRLGDEANTLEADAEDSKIVDAPPPPPLERNIQLSMAHAGDLIDELTERYSERWFQQRVRKCAFDSGYERYTFLRRLKNVAFEAQRPVLEKWGFEGSLQGVREMTAAIREHTSQEGIDQSHWLKEKQTKCLEALYGGEEGGMLAVLM